MTRRGLGSSIAVAALLAGVALLYAPALGFEFLSFDDPDYVTANPTVTGGLTAAGVRWAFSAAHAGNWHPLTWLSHMLDVELFGLDAGRASRDERRAARAERGAALPGAARADTRRSGRSFVVAALFALHPLQVESVAWVAERKNVLEHELRAARARRVRELRARGGALRWYCVGAARWRAA